MKHKKALVWSSLAFVTLGIGTLFTWTTRSADPAEVETRVEIPSRHPTPMSHAERDRASPTAQSERAISDPAYVLENDGRLSGLDLLRTKPGVPGDNPVAVIATGETQRTLSSNQVGQFPRVYTRASSDVSARITYPEGQPGERVIVEVLDGGVLSPDTVMAKAFTLDASGSFDLNYTLSANDGTHRLALRKGTDVKMLEFWVGQDRAQKL